MTTPGVGLPWAVFTDVLVDGSWQRVVTAPEFSDTLQTEPVEIERGRADEQTEMPPSALSEHWLNENGKYTPGAPMSPLYGHLGTNTPVRRGFLIAADTFTRTDATEWGTSDTGNVWVSAGSSRSTNGTQGLHSINGTNVFVQSVTGEPMQDGYWKVDYTPPFSDVTGGAIEPGNVYMRYLDSDNFYLLRVIVDIDDTYTLRILRRRGGVESFIGGPFPTVVPHVSGQTVSIAVLVEGRSFRAKVWTAGPSEPYGWELRTSDQSDIDCIVEKGQWGIRSGVATGNTNAKPIVFAYDNWDVRIIRASGELTSITPSWDITHTKKTVAVKARGLLQRLGQGDAPVRSPLRRAYDGLATQPLATVPLVYFPCEDGPDSDRIASGLPDGQPMLFNGPTPEFASNSDFVCSAPLLQLNKADLTGEIPWHTTNDAYMVRHLLGVPAGGTVNNDVILRLYFHNASIWFLDVMYHTGGDLSIQIYDFNGTLLTNTGLLSFSVDGDLDRIQLELSQVGANVSYGLRTLTVGTSSGTSATGLFGGRILGTAARVVLNPYRNIDDVTIGHIEVRQQITVISDDYQELQGFVGEGSVVRFLRLCDENGIDGTVWGNPIIAPAMGVQRVASLVSLFRECAAAIQGLLFEPRSWNALMLRTLDSMYAQAPRLILDYSAYQVAELSAPYDDAGIRNDITAERVDGSSYRVIKAQGSGPKNAGDPSEDPEAVGPYPGRLLVNVFEDSDLVDVAGQALREGTAPETRYPQVTVDLADDSIPIADYMSVLAVNIGDRVQVHSLQEADIYTTVDQIVQGYGDIQKEMYLHRFTINGTQYSPWNITVLDGTLLDGDVTTTEALDATETGIDYTCDPPLETDPAVFPYNVMIEGEECTVTSATATTLTVIRGVNQAAKPHNSGVVIALSDQASYLGR